MSEDKTQQHPGANEAFETRAREVLRAAELELPPEVNERLVAMRRAAVQELETRSGRQLQAPWYWASAGATSVFVLALGLFLYSGNTPIPMFDDFNEAFYPFYSFLRKAFNRNRIFTNIYKSIPKIFSICFG